MKYVIEAFKLTVTSTEEEQCYTYMCDDRINPSKDGPVIKQTAEKYGFISEDGEPLPKVGDEIFLREMEERSLGTIKRIDSKRCANLPNKWFSLIHV